MFTNLYHLSSVVGQVHLKKDFNKVCITSPMLPHFSTQRIQRWAGQLRYNTCFCWNSDWLDISNLYNINDIDMRQLICSNRSTASTSE